MAPIAPGISRVRKSFMLMDFNFMYITEDVPVVKISAACILALATAGVIEGMPRLKRNVVTLTPYAIPNAPSIICAKAPPKI